MRYFPKTKNEIKVNPDFNISKSMVRQPSLVDSFYVDEIVHPVTNEKLQGFHNPLYMLFNQQRLDRLGSEAIQMWLKQLEASNHSSLAELRKKCSDDDLLTMVKSRHIQHPCELARYMDNLNDRVDLFNSEVARIRGEQQQLLDEHYKQQQQQHQQQQQQVQQVNPI